MSDPQRLLYFADPMCSWCWGFAPVIARIAEERGAQLPVQIVMGGLRAGETRAITPQLRDTVLHHWHEVARASGQDFAFDGALADGFVYDTEPACRAVVAAGLLAPDKAQTMLHAVQRAFYAEARDVTCSDELVAIAASIGLDEPRYAACLDEPATHARTREDFQTTQDHGVSGFPTVILQGPERKRVVSAGFMPYPSFVEHLDRAIQRDA